MKMNRYKLLFLFVTAISFFACEEGDTLLKSDFDRVYDSTKAPVVSTVALSTQYGVEVYAKMKVENTNGLEILQQGALLSTDKEKLTLTSADTLVKASSNEQIEELVTFSDLKPETTYYIRSYAVNSEAVGYGDVKTIVTGKSWERSYNFFEDFKTASSLDKFTTLQFGIKIDRGWTPLKATSFYDSAKAANPFGTANYVFVSESYAILAEDGDITDADNVLLFTSDFTDGIKARIGVTASSFGAPPVKNANYFDSYEIIASLTPIKTKADADNATVISKQTLTGKTVGKEVIIPLTGFDGKIVYLGIRHKYEAKGYTLIVHGVTTSAMYAPI